MQDVVQKINVDVGDVLKECPHFICLRKAFSRDSRQFFDYYIF
jgi:hypothetical protein